MNLNTQEQLGQLIAQVRKSKGLTQEMLAERLGIEYSRLGKWERGVNRFPLHILALIAKELGEGILFDVDGKIKVNEGAIDMTSTYSESFLVFDVARAQETVRQQVSTRRQSLIQEAVNLYPQLKEKGFGLYNIHDNEVDLTQLSTASADEIEREVTLFIKKEDDPRGPELAFYVAGEVSGIYLDLPDFMNQLAEDHETLTQTQLTLIEKILVYDCYQAGKGPEFLSWIQTDQTAARLTQIFPQLEEWSELMAQTAQQGDYVHSFRSDDLDVEDFLDHYYWLGQLGLVDVYEWKEFLAYWDVPYESIEVDLDESVHSIGELIQEAIHQVDNYDRIKNYSHEEEEED